MTHLPCPFCGCTDISATPTRAECVMCGASAAPHRWNTRVFLSVERMARYAVVEGTEFDELTALDKDE